MSSVHNSIETVNAAATAIVTAESRTQPTTIKKKRWRSYWSLYWCFGSCKNSKRIGHAVILPEPKEAVSAAPVAENVNRTNPIVLPFIAPPSSPVSILQSEPSSATQSPGGLLSLTSFSVNAYSSCGTGSIFTIGPYAYETQLVSPPVFSTFTTEPSTAPFTPPPDPVQLTTPSSPEVPFAQLLASSLARPRRNNGMNQKFSLNQYEFHACPGSPGGNLISPGSAISNSGTTSPSLDKHPVADLCVERNPKLLGYEHFSTSRWVTRVGSGSATPNGWDSRVGSGTLTSNGWGSRLDSGTLTPNALGSRLGSGTLTPNAEGPSSQNSLLPENQISEVASLANSDHDYQNEENIIDHRVSFELTGGEVPSCPEEKPILACETVSTSAEDIAYEGTLSKDIILKKADGRCEYCVGKALNEMPKKTIEMEGRQYHSKCQSNKLESSKDFNFDSTKTEVSSKSTISSDWWSRENIDNKEIGAQKKWSFFPMLQERIS